MEHSEFPASAQLNFLPCFRPSSYDISTMLMELRQLTDDEHIWLLISLFLALHLLALGRIQGKHRDDLVHADVDEEHQAACAAVGDSGKIHRAANELYRVHSAALGVLLP
jgi:hypothetical protein